MNYDAINILLNNIKLRFFILIICKSLDDDDKYDLAVASILFMMILPICILFGRLTWMD